MIYFVPDGTSGFPKIEQINRNVSTAIGGVVRSRAFLQIDEMVVSSGHCIWIAERPKPSLR
jgi:hypothetical protein